MILEENLKDLQVAVRCGGNLVSHRPVFSSDSKKLFIISLNKVVVYSTESCGCLDEIEIPSTDEIANIVLISKNKYSPQSLFILTSGGELFEYDVGNYSELKSRVYINSKFPNEWAKIGRWINIIALPSSPYEFLFQGQAGSEGQRGEVFLYSASLSLNTPYSLQPNSSNGSCTNWVKLCWDLLPSSHSVSVGCNGNLVAALQAKSVYMEDRERKMSKWHLSGSRVFTVVAAHPTDMIVATGDDSGRILLWRDFLGNKSPPKASYHWHSLPVADLCFSTDGSQMLSGGSECCLIRWETVDEKSRKILPRLGAPISHISSSLNNTLTALSHSDNSLTLLDSSNSISGTIRNIGGGIRDLDYIEGDGGGVGGEERKSGGRRRDLGIIRRELLEYDENSKGIVMRGRAGELLAYSLKEDRILYSMDITHQNYIAPERSRNIPNTEVEVVAFSPNGTWLATGERLADEDKVHELRLKFWKYDTSRLIYVLNTSIHWAHEVSITSLKFLLTPTHELKLASGGGDKTVRIWTLVADDITNSTNSISNTTTSSTNSASITTTNSTNSTSNTTTNSTNSVSNSSKASSSSEWWTSDKVLKHRDEEVGGIGISLDGSVLAIAFGPSITCWETEEWGLKSELAHVKLRENIKLVEFSGVPTPHLLICSNSTHLIVWDVITSSLLWVIPLHVTEIAVDSLTNIVAIFTAQNHLYFMRGDRGDEPVAVHRNISRSKIESARFIPNVGGGGEDGLKSILIFKNASQELCAMLPKERIKKERKKAEKRREDERNGLASTTTLTPFAQLIASKVIKRVSSHINPITNDPSNGLNLTSSHVIRDIMDSSPHAMPSVSFFCNQLISSLSAPMREDERLDEIEKILGSGIKRTKGVEKNIDDWTSDEDENIENKEISAKNNKNYKQDSISNDINEGEELRIDLDEIVNEDTSWIVTILEKC